MLSYEELCDMYRKVSKIDNDVHPFWERVQIVRFISENLQEYCNDFEVRANGFEWEICSNGLFEIEVGHNIFLSFEILENEFLCEFTVFNFFAKTSEDSKTEVVLLFDLNSEKYVKLFVKSFEYFYNYYKEI